MLRERKTVVLRGGAPWGIRFSGGILTPVYISKVRHRSKAASSSLEAGDTVLSVNGIPTLEKTLREVNELVDSIRGQLTIEVENTPHLRGSRLNSCSSIDTIDNSPVRSIHRLTPQPQSMDYYPYSSLRTSTPTYPSYNSTAGFSQYDNTQNKRFMDSYGRLTSNPLPSIFSTAAIASNLPSNSTQGQQFSFRPPTSNHIYDTPRSYNVPQTSGYISDTNDFRKSSVSIHPNSHRNSNASSYYGTNNRQPYQPPLPTIYSTKLSTSNDQSYFSDSEYVASRPHYTKITRQANTSRRPSNIVLPIRSITSKAYDEYVPQESPKFQPPKPYDIYRQQQEERERERQQELLRQQYEQQAAAAASRFQQPPELTIPSYDRRKSDPSIDHEIGAELLKSPIANKKRYADSSFFVTAYNTYPTIEDQKKMAKKIATILEGGDPTQKGASKFEKQRQRAEKYTHESEFTTPITTAVSNYRPLRTKQIVETPFINMPGVPDCIKHSLQEAQTMNPLRIVGAPEEFKQRHMQDHVTHTMVSPQVAMSLVADLNHNRGKGAALFQKRKARSEKWVVDENNVKRSNYQSPSTYIGPSTQPWGQRAPVAWSPDDKPYSGPTFSPTRPKYNPPPTPTVSEPIFTPSPTKPVPKFGDFNARPKGFGSWNTGNITAPSPVGSIDTRKPLSLNMEQHNYESINESSTNAAPPPWSPASNSQSMFSPNPQQSDGYFQYPSSNTHSKWKNQAYSPWNQPNVQEKQQSQTEMTREGVDRVRQLLMQQNKPLGDQQYKQNATYNQHNENSANHNQYSSSKGSTQQQQQQKQHFTDL